MLTYYKALAEKQQHDKGEDDPKFSENYQAGYADYKTWHGYLVGRFTNPASEKPGYCMGFSDASEGLAAQVVPRVKP